MAVFSPKRLVKSAVRRSLRGVTLFRSHGFRITAHDFLRRTQALRADTSPLTLYLDWRRDQVQRLGLEQFRGHPVLGGVFESYYGKLDRISLVVSFLGTCLSVPGDVAEFGVYRGHTALAMDRMLDQHKVKKRLWLFDSFSGMPDSLHPSDTSWTKGDLAADVAEVRDTFQDSTRVGIIPGFFSDSFPQYTDLKYAFCHVDCDMYTSVRECIDYILPRLSPGGVIVFDDYGFRDCAGAKAAIEEYFTGAGGFVPLPTGQAIYIHTPKPSDYGAVDAHSHEDQRGIVAPTGSS